jgi:hypothetical protein
MPLTLVDEPEGFLSAYYPNNVSVTSDKSPVDINSSNTTSVKAADSADVSTYPGLIEGDIFVIHDSVTPGTWPKGQTIRLFDQDVDGYNKVWRVTKEISDTVTVIQATNEGTATTGKIQKFYENYRLIADVSASTSTMGTVVRRYQLVSDTDGVFTVEPSGFLQSQIEDVFSSLGTADLFISGQGRITLEWVVNFSEAYNIPNAEGINVFTYLEGTGDTLSSSGAIAVNNRQPYHFFNEATGVPELRWTDILGDNYVVNTAEEARYLTNHPAGGTLTIDRATAQRASLADNVYRAILVDGENPNGLLIFRSYNAHDALIGQQTQLFNMTLNSYVLNYRPDLMIAFGYVDPNADYFSVTIEDSDTDEVLVETIYINIEQSCIGAPRFYFLNSFGAVDQYSMETKVGVETSVDRKFASKPNMRQDLGTTRGDYQRRVFNVEVERVYKSRSKPENKQMLRYLGFELYESPDVRQFIYGVDSGGTQIGTYTYFVNGDFPMGIRGGRATLEWRLGVDEGKQRR